MAATAALAVAALAVLPWVTEWQVDDPVLLVALSAFALAGELLPIPVPRRRGLARVTISAAFAFAILLRFGPGPAALVYVASSVIADVAARVSPLKILFNAAQYLLAIVAAAGVLLLAHSLPMGPITGSELPIVLAAAAVFFVTNHVLACVAGALLARVPIAGYLRDDLAFQAWTAGCVLAFAPALVASADASVALVPVCFVPMLAVYFGGRQAALSSHRAHHDALTGLPNRSALSETLQAALDAAEREHRPLTVMLLDLDDFKSINDTLGHELGDLTLQRVARRLRQVVGESTVLARIGGDEFALLVDGGQAEAEVLAERLLAALDHPLEVDSVALHICASIGIACFPQHGRTSPELIRHADVAMYWAKDSDALVPHLRRGGRRVQHRPARAGGAAPPRDRARRAGRPLPAEGAAPGRRDAGGGGARALEPSAARVHRPGRVHPARRADRHHQAAHREGAARPRSSSASSGAREGLEVTVSVNVSTRSLLDHDLLTIIGTLLARLDLDASALQLEITESRIVADLPRARAALEELRAMGVMIAIDDFGTGYSSLSQLQQLPVDEIKIDRSFVTRMETDRQDAVLVHSIIDLGRNLGLRVTAEGVETENVKDVLAELGCDFAQGFHVGRPVVAQECARYLGLARPAAAADPAGRLGRAAL